MKKVLYLTKREQLVFDAVFNGAREVEVAGKAVPQMRIALANGILQGLLDNLTKQGEVVPDVFVQDVVERLIGANILTRHGTRKDTDIVGVLCVLAARDQVVVHELDQRASWELSSVDFARVQTCCDLIASVAALAPFVIYTLGVSEVEAHRYAMKLMNLGVMENVGVNNASGEQEWTPVARGFERFNFYVTNPVSASKPVPAVAKPKAVPKVNAKTVAPKAEAVKPKPEPVAVTEPKGISLAEAIVFLTGRREESKSSAMSDRAMVVAEMEKIKNLLADEKKRLSEAIANGAPIDNGLYNSLVEKGCYLENRLAQPDETELLKAYDAVVADLTEAFSQTHAFTFPEKPTVVPTMPEKPAETQSVAVGKAKSTRPFRRSKTGLSSLEIGIVAMSRAREDRDHWFKMAEIMPLTRKVDRTIKDAPLVNAFRYEAEERKSGGQIERRQSNPEETRPLCKRFEYRLTEAGQLAVEKVEKRLVEMKGEVTVAVIRPDRKRKVNHKGRARTEMRGLNSQLAKFTLCAATGNLPEWFTLNDLCELLRTDFPEIKSANVCSSLSAECGLKGGFFTRKQPDMAGLKDQGGAKFLYKLTDDGRAFAAKVADAGSGSADASPKPVARGKKDGKLNLGQRIAFVWANTPSCRDNLTAAQIMVLAQSGDHELKNKQISQSLRSGYFCDLFRKIVPTREGGNQVVLYSLTELARSMRKGN